MDDPLGEEEEVEGSEQEVKEQNAPEEVSEQSRATPDEHPQDPRTHEPSPPEESWPAESDFVEDDLEERNVGKSEDEGSKIAVIETETMVSQTPEETPPVVVQPIAVGKRKKKKDKKWWEKGAQFVQDAVVSQPVGQEVVTVKIQQEHAPSLQADAAPEPDIDVLIERLRETNLKEVDLSAVVECLLMRQEYLTKKEKSTEEVGKLRKELAENEKLLVAETKLVEDANGKMRQCRADYENEKSKGQAMEKTYRQELSNLRTANEKAQAENSRLQQQVAQSYQQTTQLQQLQAQLHTLQHQGQQSSQVQNEHYQEKQRLQIEVNQTRSQAQISEEGRRELEASVKQLQTERNHSAKQDQKLIEIQAQLSAKEEECSRTENQLAELKEAWSKLEQSVEHLREEYRQSQNELQESRSALEKVSGGNDLTKELERVRKELTDVKSSSCRLEEELDVVSKKRSEFEVCLKRLEEELERERGEKARWEAETGKGLSLIYESAVLKGLEEDLERERGEKARLEAETGAIQAQLGKEMTELRGTLAALETEKRSWAAQEEKAVSCRHKELESALNAKNRMEAEVTELKNQLNSTKEECNGFQKQIAAMEGEMAASLKNKDSKLATALTDMENLCQEMKVSKQELAELEKWREVAKAEIESLKSEGRASVVEIERLRLERETLAKVQQTTKLGADYDSMNSEVKNLREALANRDNLLWLRNQEMGNLRAELKNRQREFQELTLSSKRLHISHSEAVGKLRDELQKRTGELAQIRQDIDAQKQKNNDLREQNYKMVDVVQQTEKTCKELVGKTEKEWKAKLLAEQQQKVTAGVCRHGANASNSGDNEILRAEVVSYKEVLATVGMDLRRFEERVVQEETRWKDRCLGLEKALIQVKEEAKAAVNEEHMRSTEEATKDLQQVKAQLSQLRLKLESEERERVCLREEIRILERDLETERSTGRELSSQAVKLRGMLKTGQDALKQEQQLVQQLENQLKLCQAKPSSDSELKRSAGSYQENSVATPEQNGTDETTLQTEINELRTRLADREQQLEKEMMMNKQLSNKLASLGVSV